MRRVCVYVCVCTVDSPEGKKVRKKNTQRHERRKKLKEVRVQGVPSEDEDLLHLIPSGQSPQNSHKIRHKIFRQNMEF